VVRDKLYRLGEKLGREAKQMDKARILIVEDEPNIVESLSFILRRAGFDVETATDGAQALDRVRRQPFSALVLDIMLPGMNGFDVLKAIRADRALAALPVIVLTAKGQADDRRTAEAMGASAFITKPFSNAEVVKHVSRLAGGEG
jgi:DNA-binding response OmpR family regulator